MSVLPNMLLTTHLQRVSRSFAFCIAVLNSQLRDQVSVMYLVCRILDTIEDSLEIRLSQKEEIYRLLLLSFRLQRVDPALIQLLESLNTLAIKDSEKQLLKDFSKIFDQHYLRFDKSVQEVLIRLVDVMSSGMLFFEQKKQAQGILKIESYSELDQYCYSVAGCVGEALSSLVFESKSQQSPPLMALSRDFGNFLQLINMIKDFSGDVTEGRNFLGFIGSESKFEKLHFERLTHSVLQYILQLEATSHSDFRLFCAWSFALGLKTLQLWEANHFEWSQTPLKVSRTDAVKIIAAVKFAHKTPSELIRYLATLSPEKSRHLFDSASSQSFKAMSENSSL